MSVLPLESQLFKMLQDSHKFEASHELLNETLSNKKQNKQAKPLFDLLLTF